MSDPNILNLDALEPAITRAIKHEGVSHEFVPITVEMWLANLRDVRKTAAAVEAAETPDVIADLQMSLMIRSILRSYPTFTEADLKAMDLEKLDAIVRFTRALDGSDKTEKRMLEEAAANPPEPSQQTTTA